MVGLARQRGRHAGTCSDFATSVHANLVECESWAKSGLRIAERRALLLCERPQASIWRLIH
jgi:hypothetical protein